MPLPVSLTVKRTPAVIFFKFRGNRQGFIFRLVAECSPAGIASRAFPARFSKSAAFDWGPP